MYVVLPVLADLGSRMYSYLSVHQCFDVSNDHDDSAPADCCFCTLCRWLCRFHPQNWRCENGASKWVAECETQGFSTGGQHVDGVVTTSPSEGWSRREVFQSCFWRLRRLPHNTLKWNIRVMAERGTAPQLTFDSKDCRKDWMQGVCDSVASFCRT